MKNFFNKNFVTKGLEVLIITGIVGIATLASVFGKKEDIIIDNNEHPNDDSFDIAIKAIMKSDMYSHDKTEAVSLVRRNESASYYNAVASIAESDMFSSSKVTAIKTLR